MRERERESEREYIKVTHKHHITLLYLHQFCHINNKYIHHKSVCGDFSLKCPWFGYIMATSKFDEWSQFFIVTEISSNGSISV